MKNSPYVSGLILWLVLSGLAAAALLVSLGATIAAVILVLIALNVGTFLFYGADKFFALAKWRRVPERMLYIAAFAGGSAGALAGMWVFRHKTSKTSFQLVLALLILLQVGMIYFFLNSEKLDLTPFHAKMGMYGI